MSLAQKPGTLGNLTPVEEQKLQQSWVHILRLCGIEDLDTGTLSSIPDRSDEFRKHLTDKTTEGFNRNFWATVRAEHPDGLVLRFLRARKWDVEKAVIMLISAVDWRKEAKVDSSVVFHGEDVALKESPSVDEKSFIQQYRSGKSFVRGTDKAQRPVYIIRVRLHDPYAQSAESMESYILHNIESLRALVKAPYDEACLIFDMTGFGLKNMDFHVVKFLIQVFESKYPETLGVVLIHNAPFVFWGLWNVIKGWLDPVIASKINFTRSKSDMERFIAPENLQKCYGGEDPWEYEYVEPVPGENDKLKDEEGRERIMEARWNVVRDIVRETVEWARLDVESDEAKAASKKRDQVVDKLHSNYWELDPYVRATTYLRRAGVVNEKHEVDFKGAKGISTKV
ncbi:Phosphatidylinositol transfer protein-like protein [Hapsidospora chrysogenum ATCC 11550]|uniref:Phosphatidylinositol transfer protein-like protein n=1 Tax=Hapsidospora chrysogenum (strain ATCC 11550 / CBS 779.69 / DSM 880 / IAM 14645 / JCM 23072 / IMI 49137) TaxID=857340 RepID=A0A086T6S3_HAPC1|nr:Phosphatidylinositol transfer protein-like protein [Hapsidospora chrysogenum ATCC 11550]